MRTPHAKSSARTGGDQSYFPVKRREMIAVAAYYRAEHRGFRGGDALGDWLEAEAEVAHLLASRPGDDLKAKAKQRFQQIFEERLKAWDARLDELKAKARDAKAEVCAEFEVQLEVLASKRTLAQEKLQELRRHGQWAWEDLKQGAEQTWSDLREALKRGASLFK